MKRISIQKIIVEAIHRGLADAGYTMTVFHGYADNMTTNGKYAAGRCVANDTKDVHLINDKLFDDNGDLAGVRYENIDLVQGCIRKGIVEISFDKQRVGNTLKSSEMKIIVDENITTETKRK